MSAHKHTPGPWRLGKDYGAVVADHSTTERPDSGHADVEHYGGHLVCESVALKANAHLIAAAPDMLLELKGLENYLEIGLKTSTSPKTDAKVAARLRAIIAKAEGRS